MAQCNVNGTPIPVLIDSGADITTIGGMAPGPRPALTMTDLTCEARGIGSDTIIHTLAEEVPCEIGGHEISLQPWYSPHQQFHILGRDTLTKLRAVIEFTNEGINLVIPGQTRQAAQIMTTLPDALADIPDTLWSKDPTDVGRLMIEPIRLQVKANAALPNIRQYPVAQDKLNGIRPLINKLLGKGVLAPTTSPCNTPIFPIKKPNRDEYRMIHDLRAVNDIMEPLAVCVANPITVLAPLKPQHQWYTVMDLSNAFFSVPVHPDSQHLFAFTYEGRQLTWTVLPQGFIHSPTLFSQILQQDLADIRPHVSSEICVYMDDVLVAAETREQCERDSVTILKHLATKQHKVSLQKLQWCTQTVTYVGHTLSKGLRLVTPERQTTVASFPEPTTPRQVRGFLGTVGYCRQWIANYSEKAAPLEELLKADAPSRFTLTPQQRHAFEQLKQCMVTPPALRIPDPSKAFHLFCDNSPTASSAVLCQYSGNKPYPVLWVSQKLSPVEQGLPPCYKTCAAILRSYHQASSVLLGAHVTIHTSHSVAALLQRGRTTIVSPARFTQWEASLLRPDVTIKPCTSVNPATLALSAGLPHDCCLTTDQNSKIRSDLQETPLADGIKLFCDGSFSHGKGGWAVVEAAEGAQAQPPLEPFTTVASGTANGSAQIAELLALTAACEYATGRAATIYTDSRYAFGVVHDFGMAWAARGFLTSVGSPVKNAAFIDGLLTAMLLPEKLAVVKVAGHSKADTFARYGNDAADRAAKDATSVPISRGDDPRDSPSMLCPVLRSALRGQSPQIDRDVSKDNDAARAVISSANDVSERDTSGFSTGSDNCIDASNAQENWFSREMYLPEDVLLENCTELDNGLRVHSPTGLPVPPTNLVEAILRQYHLPSHASKRGIWKLWKQNWFHPKAHSILDKMLTTCQKCLQHNPKLKRTKAHRPCPAGPFSQWQIDFVQMSDVQPKYALVMVDVFTRWPEVFPTRNEKASTVVEKLLSEVIPRWGLPLTIDSDQGTHFTADIVKELNRALGIKWQYHCSKHPRSSGIVERLNRTLKQACAKTTDKHWTHALPWVLWIQRATPRAHTSLSPYEIAMGRPMPYPDIVPMTFTHLEANLHLHLQNLVTVLRKYHSQVQAAWPEPKLPPGPPEGSYVLTKTPPATSWSGPHQVLLSTPTAVKLQGHPHWVHLDFCKPLTTDALHAWYSGASSSSA